MRAVGHNAGIAGGDLFEAADGGEAVMFRFLPLHLGDYVTGTSEMTLEEEGAYIRFLVALYARGKPFPDDDRLMIRVMSLSIRVWKRLKASLMATGKILLKNCGLTNSRFEIERQKRAAEIRTKAESATKRWANSAQTSAKLPAKEEKKVNEINDAPVKEHMLSVTDIRNPESKERKNRNELLLKLERAAGTKLDKNSLALESLTVVYGWLDSGCDLELDILPAISAACVTRETKAKSWAVFGEDVINHRNARQNYVPAAPKVIPLANEPAWKRQVIEKANREKEERAKLAAKWRAEDEAKRKVKESAYA